MGRPSGQVGLVGLFLAGVALSKPVGESGTGLQPSAVVGLASGKI